MEYIHYFPHSRDFTDNEWTKIVDAYGFLYEKGTDETILDVYFPTRPDDHICFRGIGGAHDRFNTIIFSLHQKQNDLNPMHCNCDTARQPYDKYVTAILSIADYYAPGALQITSDGYSVCQFCMGSQTCLDYGTAWHRRGHSGIGQAKCWLPGILLATEVCGITHMPKGLKMELEE